MKLLLAVSVIAFLSIAAPAVGINPALMATRLFAEEKRSGYKQLFFKKAQHRRLEDTGGGTSTKASLPPMEEDDGLDDVDDGDYYYDYDFSPPPLSSSCLLSLQLTQGLMMQDERMNDLFLAEDQDMYMELYDSICNSAGGQTLTMNFETSAECNQPSILNVPGCLGAICDEEDIEVYAVYVGEGPFQGPTDESCSIETSVVSDGEGDPSQFPDIPGGCVDGMTDIFMSDIYDDFSEIVIDEDTGMFTGDTEALAVVTAQCLELGGHMTTISMDYYGGECDEYVDLTSVPFCVSNMCNEDEAQEFVTVFLSPSFFEECEGMKITLATSNMVTDEMKAPKMPKTAKTPKELKMPKAPKMPKELKMPKIPKAPKITKAPVA